MTRIIIESPYAGDVEQNIDYARACVRDSLKRGEAPIASHLLFTQPGILDDTLTEERRLGINAGLAWLPVANGHAFYVDRGISGGMKIAYACAQEYGTSVMIRSLHKIFSSEEVSDIIRQLSSSLVDSSSTERL